MRVTVDVTDEPQDRPVTVTIQIGADATDETPDPALPVVAGAQPDTWPAPSTADPLQQVSELPDERHRRGIGYTT